MLRHFKQVSFEIAFPENGREELHICIYFHLFIMGYFQENWDQRKVWNPLYKYATQLIKIRILSEGRKLSSDQMQMNEWLVGTWNSTYIKQMAFSVPSLSFDHLSSPQLGLTWTDRLKKVVAFWNCFYCYDISFCTIFSFFLLMWLIETSQKIVFKNRLSISVRVNRFSQIENHKCLMQPWRTLYQKQVV